MKKTITILGAMAVLFTLPLEAQVSKVPDPTHPGSRGIARSGVAAESAFHTAAYQSLKRPGHYSAQDWRAVIDSLWGSGLPAADKLKIFDDFWALVDQRWGGFPNLAVNWDSLRNLYRPEVAAGVSRGRFAAILCRLTYALNEDHVHTMDLGIDSTMRYYAGSDAEYPNYPSFHYQSGLPLLTSPMFRTWFGAGLTPLPDSTALVYSVMPNHPLGLQPGDIILGYDGIPWMRLFNELFEAGLPFLGGKGGGSSAAASLHMAIMSAGTNWGLFDTIDVAKYPANEVVHYPTTLLNSIQPPYFAATEQLPVSGIPFPDISHNKMVSWGVIAGTSIGYIYAWDWWGGVPDQTSVLFAQAVDELLNKYRVQGMIIDFRKNWGGFPSYANAGFSKLFNVDPFSNYSVANRLQGNDHLAFSFVQFSQEFLGSLSPMAKVFDRPIAVLTGPGCVSGGDYNAHRMRFHPMTRFFGLPTSGAFTAYANVNDVEVGVWKTTYDYRIDPGSAYSNYANEGFLMHKPPPVDEEVWLTRDGVAKGKDDVVARALDWINTLSYAHDVQLAHLSRDTLRITARVQNPLGHTLKVTAILSDGVGALIDSLSLKDDGLHGDGAADDSLWGYMYVPPGDASIHATIRTDDLTAGPSRTLPDAASIEFTRKALITMDTRTVDLGRISVGTSHYDTSCVVRNIGYTTDSLTVSVDPVNVTPDTAVAAFPKTFRLAPGDSQKVTFSIRPGLLSSAYYAPQVIVQSKSAFGQTLFLKNYQFQVVISSVSDNTGLPTTYTLDQNYPNPFNPTTTITYGLPRQSQVSLVVYNTLGQQVATLVQGDQEAGYHEVKFDATNFSSGVYFYRITAGSFVQTRKLLVLR